MTSGLPPLTEIEWVAGCTLPARSSSRIQVLTTASLCSPPMGRRMQVLTTAPPSLFPTGGSSAAPALSSSSFILLMAPHPHDRSPCAHHGAIQDLVATTACMRSPRRPAPRPTGERQGLALRPAQRATCARLLTLRTTSPTRARSAHHGARPALTVAHEPRRGARCLWGSGASW